jgi:hypothetical protein
MKLKMKNSTVGLLIFIFILGVAYVLFFQSPKNKTKKEVETYLNKKEDNHLLEYNGVFYDFKLGRYLVYVKYKDEPNIEYMYGYIKEEDKIKLYYIENDKNGVEEGKHDSLFNYIKK